MFGIGQKVVCIYGGPWSPPIPPFTPPRKGGIYRVRAFEEAFGRQWVELSEYPPMHGVALVFSAKCFRPVIERETDIGIFTKLLTPAPREKVDA